MFTICFELEKDSLEVVIKSISFFYFEFQGVSKPETQRKPHSLSQPQREVKCKKINANALKMPTLGPVGIPKWEEIRSSHLPQEEARYRSSSWGGVRAGSCSLLKRATASHRIQCLTPLPSLSPQRSQVFQEEGFSSKVLKHTRYDLTCNSVNFSCSFSGTRKSNTGVCSHITNWAAPWFRFDI